MGECGIARLARPPEGPRPHGIQSVGWSQNGAAGSHLKGGNAPAVEDYEPVTVPAAQQQRLLRQDGYGHALQRGEPVTAGHQDPERVLAEQ
jgi:hypothetical protein